MKYLLLHNKILLFGFIAGLIALIIEIKTSTVLMFAIIIGFIAYISFEVSRHKNRRSDEEGENI